MRTLLLIAGITLLPIAAMAEPSAADKALAQSLFKDGRALMNAGKTAEACAKFSESDRLDPEIGTHLNLALCHEAQGKTASAWVEFGETADQADRIHDDERSKFAHQHAQDLEKKLSRVRLRVDQPAAGTTIAIDGAAIGQAGWASAVPLDPGAHELRVEAPGKKTWTKPFEVPATTELAVPALEDAAVTTAPPPPPNDEPKSGSPLRLVGFITAGVGVAGIAVGSIFGVMTISANDKANTECTLAMGKCTQAGVDAGRNADTFATVSTIAFIAGGVLAAGGAVLILAGKPSKKTGARVVPLLGGLQIMGSF
jgi:hypothetical protein